ncbi:MAG: hypothetical protein M3430_09065 [Acidobacteriota bacterium]|nr:hypothetical protein [Acidobacteriota bacterium]
MATRADEKLPLGKLIGRRITFDAAGSALASLAASPGKGITVIDRFAPLDDDSPPA